MITKGQIIKYQQHLPEAAYSVYSSKREKELKVAKMMLILISKWGNFGFAGHHIITHKVIYLKPHVEVQGRGLVQQGTQGWWFVAMSVSG